MSLYLYHMISIFNQTGEQLSRNFHESHISTILLLYLFKESIETKVGTIILY